MNDDAMLDYPALIDKAMRDVVREVLQQVQEDGLPGDHHFYISYNTNHPGVKMSEQLKERYPQEITIVMQHQFWDFKVDKHKFQVTLSFGGVPEKLTVPFAALTAFADPSVKFGLQFQTSDDDLLGMIEIEDEDIISEDDDAQLDILDEDKQEGDAEKIISLDSFRKK